jgi:hypothetical protein
LESILFNWYQRAASLWAKLARKGHHQNDQQQGWKGIHDVHEAHQEVVHAPAHITGNHADEQANDEAGQWADTPPTGNPRAIDNAGP